MLAGRFCHLWYWSSHLSLGKKGISGFPKILNCMRFEFAQDKYYQETYRLYFKLEYLICTRLYRFTHLPHHYKLDIPRLYIKQTLTKKAEKLFCTRRDSRRMTGGRKPVCTSLLFDRTPGCQHSWWSLGRTVLDSSSLVCSYTCITANKVVC